MDGFQLLVNLVLPELQFLKHQSLLLMHRLEQLKELSSERVSGGFYVLQLLKGPHIPTPSLFSLLLELLKSNENEQLGVASALQALLQCRAEIEGLQAVLEVLLNQLEQLLAFPNVFLAFQDNFDHFLVHLQEALGDLLQGIK
ncbi:hypothetical protein TorRG33x02_193350 [Trema orientale]|uniref:Uncharacterized protein n=1 Tax=Trema orientale TaxID=63057 RepID=A0A2P5EHB5_TREOI|nr:hypothetical protein TorRG33x02_193350 [Trema orientale]